MKAVLVDKSKQGAEKLYLGEAPLPQVAPHEILVQVKAFGLNRLDIIQREGYYPPPPGASEVLGVEFSGIVSQLGENVTAVQVGDEVLGLVAGGSYAEFVAVPAVLVVPKPSHISWETAAGIMENFLTAFQAVQWVADLQPGEKILVHTGASGVGLAAIQIAHSIGAQSIFTTASLDDKLEFLKTLPNGPTHTINYKKQDFAEEVSKATDGKGVNVLIDFVAQTHWNGNLASLGMDGRMVMLALLSGGQVQGTNLAPILMKRLRIQGSTLRSRTLEYQGKLVEDFKVKVLPKFSASETPLKVIIHKTYSWKDIIAAHQEMEGNTTVGKIIALVD